MVSTSVFGTGRAARILGLALLPSLLTGASPPPPTVEVSVTGLRSEQGQVLVCLTPNRKAFPDCSQEADSVRMAVQAAAAGHFAVDAPAAQSYAIALVPPTNRNKKMNHAIIRPTDSYH